MTPSTFAILLAISLMSAGMAACSREPQPVQVARRYAQAMRSGDTAMLFPLLERELVSKLEAAAERASEQVGGRRNIDAHEMLHIVDVDAYFQVASAELLDDDEDTSARVKLIGTDRSEHIVVLGYEDGAWRVRIANPLGEPSLGEPSLEVAP